MKTIIIIIVILGVVIGSALIISSYANKDDENDNSYLVSEIVSGSADIQIKKKADKDLAIAKAKELWRAKVLMGEDLSDGPCLSNKVIPDWVADIVHDPRQEVDDMPANQCSAYREGSAHHFVELDLDGNLIRAQ